MRFGAAFERLEAGKAIRRVRWAKDQCLRMKHGSIYVCTDQWHRKLKSLDATAINASDWEVINDYQKASPKEDLLAYLQKLNNSI